ncbi:MAG: DNA-3-methyladenine glycosylase [Actinobacteria bacterium]|nr:DNA-3-methyladenine glycosylase [Actinomycetota bacterium]
MPAARESFGSMLPASWFQRDAPVVGRELLNKVLVSRVPGDEVVAGRIIEVEAYTQDDPASHTFGGPTPRNRVMFGPPGRLYVYLSYGIHHCANVVTAQDGVGQALLLRAVTPVHGIETIRLRRHGRPDRELVDGPGKLCEAFAIDLGHYGTNLTDTHSPVTVIDDGMEPPSTPVIGPRIGISKGVETPWRFRVPAGRGRDGSVQRHWIQKP